ncbi:hypothetical protein HK096_003148 [Nowakowskiella sp. JEL0078]|nr:hypothetical protein HK096_003148 [Nowakowskiella sp. JEL0078]
MIEISQQVEFLNSIFGVASGNLYANGNGLQLLATLASFAFTMLFDSILCWWAAFDFFAAVLGVYALNPSFIIAFFKNRVRIPGQSTTYTFPKGRIRENTLIHLLSMFIVVLCLKFSDTLLTQLLPRESVILRNDSFIPKPELLVPLLDGTCSISLCNFKVGFGTSIPLLTDNLVKQKSVWREDMKMYMISLFNYTVGDHSGTELGCALNNSSLPVSFSDVNAGLKCFIFDKINGTSFEIPTPSSFGKSLSEKFSVVSSPISKSLWSVSTERLKEHTWLVDKKNSYWNEECGGASPCGDSSTLRGILISLGLKSFDQVICTPSKGIVDTLNVTVTRDLNSLELVELITSVPYTRNNELGLSKHVKLSCINPVDDFLLNVDFTQSSTGMSSVSSWTIKASSIRSENEFAKSVAAMGLSGEQLIYRGITEVHNVTYLGIAIVVVILCILILKLVTFFVNSSKTKSLDVHMIPENIHMELFYEFLCREQFMDSTGRMNFPGPGWSFGFFKRNETDNYYGIIPPDFTPAIQSLPVSETLENQTDPKI